MKQSKAIFAYPGIIALITTLILSLISPYSTVFAQSQAVDSLNPKQLETFFDGLLAAQLEIFHIPGATIAVVQGDKMIFAKGYGSSEVVVEQPKPVVADQTLFSVASLSKLFVWTAVMQLVEQGKVDLKADVNLYLKDFKIPSTYSQPVTLLDLMNHTTGFEENSLEEYVRTEGERQPLGKYLATHMPKRVRPSGALTAYSNYGASLAGYIVSQVSGLPFEQYVEDYIFKPLQMQHSTFRQPLPASLVDKMALGYHYAGGRYHSDPTSWSQSFPAAALRTTATDLANFMIAHLQKGRVGASRILQENTIAQMHEQSFTNDPKVNGFAHGFMVVTLNNYRLLAHLGDNQDFHSGLILSPELQVGLVVAYNGQNGVLAVMNTIRAFMDHFYPANSAVVTSPPASAAGLETVAKYAGNYRPARSEYSTRGKIVGMLQSITVQAAGPHDLIISLGFPPQLQWHYLESSPGVFRSVDQPPSLFGDTIFRADSTGQIYYLFQENNPTTAYLKQPWYAEPEFNLGLLGVCMVVFLAFLGWIPLRLWLYRRLKQKISRQEQVGWWCALLLCSLSLVFVVGFVVLYSDPQTVLGLPLWANFLYIISWLIAGLTLSLTVFTVLGWLHRYGSRVSRVYYTLLMLAALAFVWWLGYWNLYNIG